MTTNNPRMTEDVVSDGELTEDLGYFEWLCTDSKHPMHHRVLAALRELKQRREDGWVSVKDRLPERDDGDYQGWVQAYDAIDYRAVNAQYSAVRNYPMRFTHWRPLPAPPVEPARCEACGDNRWEHRDGQDWCLRCGHVNEPARGEQEGKP